MKTTAFPETSFPTTSTSPILNSSELQGQTNATSSIPRNGFGMSCFTMILGTVSNLTALGILFHSRARFRRQSKATFLQLTVTLLLVDLGSHLIPGSFAMYVHSNSVNKLTGVFCQIFGASMVFFGLSPLLLGCAMAVERCVAITQPFFHVSMITATHVKRAVLILFSPALTLAILPFCNVGTYTIQTPDTWCFFPIHDSLRSVENTILLLAFSCLGLTALTFSLLCNILSGVTLLQARMGSSKGYTENTAPSARRASSTSSSSVIFSLDVEMMMQLAMVIVVSWICWGPFLINSLIQLKSHGDSNASFTALTLYLATWNQILDPWVYILLRRTLLLRVGCSFPTRKPSVTADYSSPDTRRAILILQ